MRDNYKNNQHNASNEDDSNGFNSVNVRNSLLRSTSKTTHFILGLVGFNILTLISSAMYMGRKVERIDNSIDDVLQLKKTQITQDLELARLEEKFTNIKDSLDEIKGILKRDKAASGR